MKALITTGLFIINMTSVFAVSKSMQQEEKQVHIEMNKLDKQEGKILAKAKNREIILLDIKRDYWTAREHAIHSTREITEKYQIAHTFLLPNILSEVGFEYFTRSQ